MEPSVVTTLASFLKFLSGLSLDYALVGGVAAGYWSEERFTKDIDFTIALTAESWLQLKSNLESLSDVVINRIHNDPDSELPYLIRIHYQHYPIDLIVSLTEYQESLLSRKVTVDFLGTKVQIASPEDIIVSKLIAGRSQDLVDAEKIAQRLSDLDQAYIEKWAKVWEVSDRWNQIQDRLREIKKSP